MRKYNLTFWKCFPLLLLVIAWELFHSQRSSPSQSTAFLSGKEIITFNTFRNSLLYSSTTIIILFVGSLWAAVLKKTRGWVPFAVLAGGSLIWCSGAISDIGDFDDIASYRSPDGTEYHMFSNCFLQGSQVVIGRRIKHSSSQDQFEVLVRSGWRKELGCLTVVRAQGATKESQLYVTPKGLLVGVLEGNVAYLAIDLHSDKTYGDSIDSGTEAHKDLINDLSPFLLLGATDTPSDADFETLKDPDDLGRPKLEAVSNEIHNPNSKVRDLASKLYGFLLTHPKSDKYALKNGGS